MDSKRQSKLQNIVFALCGLFGEASFGPALLQEEGRWQRGNNGEAEVTIDGVRIQDGEQSRPVTGQGSDQKCAVSDLARQLIVARESDRLVIAPESPG